MREIDLRTQCYMKSNFDVRFSLAYERHQNQARFYARSQIQAGMSHPTNQTQGSELMVKIVHLSKWTKLAAVERVTMFRQFE